MKRIQLEAVLPPRDPASAITEHQLYQVFVGNGNRCFFTSTRHAEQFNAAVNDVLNTAMFRASVLLADVYPIWRMAWHYLDKAPGDDKHAEQCIKDADAALNRALRRRGGSDYITFAWRDVERSVRCVHDLCVVLRDFYRVKGHGVERARLEVLIDAANVLSELLQHFGGTQADAPNAVIVQRRTT